MDDPAPAIDRTQTSTQDRRRETRWPTDGPVKITAITSDTGLDGYAVDVSEAGIRVRIPARLRELEPVRLEFRDMMLYGKVRWCKNLDDHSFHAGIEVAVRAAAE